MIAANRVAACHSKRRYWSEVDALVQAAKLVCQPRKIPTLRAYQCPSCGGWHLTKRPAWTKR